MKNSIKKTFLLMVALTGLVACNNQTSTSSSSAQPTSSASTISSNSSSSSITNSSTSSSKPSSSSSSTIDYGKVYFNDRFHPMLHPSGVKTHHKRILG